MTPRRPSVPLLGIGVYGQSPRQNGDRRKSGIGPDLATRALRQGNPRAFALTLAGRAAKLGRQLHDLGNACRADGMTSTEKPAAGIDWQPAAKGCRALPKQLDALVRRCEAKSLVKHDFRGRGCIMDLGHMNILGTEPGLVIGLLPRADGGDRVYPIPVGRNDLRRPDLDIRAA